MHRRPPNAVVNIADITLFFVSAMNAIGCALVVGLTALKRRQHARTLQDGWGHV
jgi:hypothetical protein